MFEDRTWQSEQFTGDDMERPGVQARPFIVSEADELFAEALDAAVAAGACHVMARLNPQSQAIWRSVASAKTRQAKAKVAQWLEATAGR